MCVTKKLTILTCWKEKYTNKHFVDQMFSCTVNYWCAVKYVLNHKILPDFIYIEVHNNSFIYLYIILYYIYIYIYI